MFFDLSFWIYRKPQNDAYSSFNQYNLLFRQWHMVSTDDFAWWFRLAMDSIWHPLIAAAMQRAEPSVLVINDNATQEFDAAFCCSCAILSECHLERWFSSVLTVLSYGFPWTKRLNGTIFWCHHVGCWLYRKQISWNMNHMTSQHRDLVGMTVVKRNDILSGRNEWYLKHNLSF